MKIQTKTTILFTILTATIFLILNITVYYFINSFADRDFVKRLELRVRLADRSRFEPGRGSTEALGELQQQYLEKLPDEESLIVNLDSLKKSSGTITELPENYLQRIEYASGATVFYQKGFRHFAGLLRVDSARRFLVIESATNEYGSLMMRRLAFIKVATFVVAVALIYTVGLYFSRRTFRPIRDIIDRVKDISRGNLHLRLRQQEGADEIAELSRTFNQMLNRLQTAFEIQNNFISNASHELRTPLTAIVGEADYALTKSRSAETYQYSLQQISQQAAKLEQLVKGLLALAQTGFTGKGQVLQRIRLDQLLFDVKQNCDAILPENKVHINLDALPADEESISITGHYETLRIAIDNIVLNACKYSKNAPVLLSLLPHEGQAVIVVKDQGIGIPAEDLPYIYDPFFRASNAKEYEGYGIGMPLSNNIIRLHNGAIAITSEVGQGTEVRITLPVT